MASAPATTPALTAASWRWQGCDIRYTVGGQGLPVVLVHGFGASSEHWRKNQPVLARAGYRTYAIDLLGFGGSAKPKRAYSIELWQQLLVDFWQAQIGEPAIWVGNSIGGLIALSVMAHQPHVVAGGVLINCAGGLSHRPEELSWPLGLAMRGFSWLANAPLVGPLLFDRIRQPGHIRRTLQQVYGDRNAVTDELVELIRRPTCDPGAQQVFASILAAPPGPKSSELLPRVRAPLLVLWGDADPWTPISSAHHYRELSERRADVTFQAIAGAGHCCHDECPERVNACLLDWLQRTLSLP